MRLTTISTFRTPTLDEKVDFSQTQEVAPEKKIRPHIFRHELLQAFFLALVCETPRGSDCRFGSFRSLARRVALAALTDPSECRWPQRRSRVYVCRIQPARLSLAKVARL
jgi:hypothetical protein